MVELLAEVFMTLFANVELAANNVGTNSKHFHVRVLPEVYLKHQSSYPYFWSRLAVVFAASCLHFDFASFYV